MEHPRPRIYCSRCLEHDSCRFDGAMIKSPIVSDLKRHCEIEHDCPESGIGLGVPRRPVRVVETDGRMTLVQPALGLDHTKAMEGYISDLLSRTGEVDGFILKSKSPTCGMGDVKIYPGPEKVPVLRMGDGFLGLEIRNRSSHLAVEDEARLQDVGIRDHFLTKLYALARLREARMSGNANDLIAFHSRHKLLLMSYNQSQLRVLGRIVATQKEKGITAAFSAYAEGLSQALAKGPKHTNIINTMMHAFGYVSEGISPDERAHFLDMIALYREDRIPFSACRELLRSLANRFDVEYLKDQYFFEPYPVSLVVGYEPHRGRDLWK
jgi:uncharacterized protein YbgA (DUF1722 family)/uncharacterized protein YbbK (DUF523 family)